MSSPRARRVAAAAAVVTGAFTIGWRFLTFSGFGNDHYVHLARAQQWVLGEWPVRDFVDPGLPLMYGVSAIALLTGGRALGTELALVSGALALGSALIVTAGARLSGSVGIGAATAVLGVLMNPRSYAYPKVLLYAALAALVCRPGDRVSDRRVMALGALTAVAFLFRHDHGLFVGLGSATFVLAQSARGGWVSVRRPLGVLAGTVVLCLLPWAVFVSAYAGLWAYVVSAVEFSAEEGRANVLGEFPRILLTGGTPSRSDGVSLLFYVFHLLPAVCLPLALWRRRHAREDWAGETSAVVAMSVVAIPVNLSFLRDFLPARLPDAFVPAALLGAWLLGLGLRRPRRALAILRVAVALALALVSAAAVGLAADLRAQVDQTRLLERRGALSERAADLWLRLRREIPERDHVPSRFAASLLPFTAFLQRCTSRDDRVLVTSLRPEIYVLADRGFAGGHIAFIPGFYARDADQALTLARLRRQSVPFVARILDADVALAKTMPQVLEYLDRRYEPLADVPVEGTLGVRVSFERGRVADHVDEATGWPCLTGARR